MKKWIYFNGNYIRSESITAISKTGKHIEVYSNHMGFNQLFDSEEALKSKYECLLEQLGVDR